jgi:hypothetical protein
MAIILLATLLPHINLLHKIGNLSFCSLYLLSHITAWLSNRKDTGKITLYSFTQSKIDLVLVDISLEDETKNIQIKAGAFYPRFSFSLPLKFVKFCVKGAQT